MYAASAGSLECARRSPCRFSQIPSRRAELQAREWPKASTQERWSCRLRPVERAGDTPGAIISASCAGRGHLWRAVKLWKRQVRTADSPIRRASNSLNEQRYRNQFPTQRNTKFCPADQGTESAEQRIRAATLSRGCRSAWTKTLYGASANAAAKTEHRGSPRMRSPHRHEARRRTTGRVRAKSTTSCYRFVISVPYFAKVDRAALTGLP